MSCSPVITSDYLMGLLTGESDPDYVLKRVKRAKASDEADDSKSESGSSKSNNDEADGAEDEQDRDVSPARKKARVAAEPEEMDDATLKREIHNMLGKKGEEAHGTNSEAAALARALYERTKDELNSVLARAVNDGRLSVSNLLKGWQTIYSLLGESEAACIEELRRDRREARALLRAAEGKGDKGDDGEDDDDEVIQ